MREVSRPKYTSRGRSFTTISPVPGCRRMRATEVLRFPVAQMADVRSGLMRGLPALRQRYRLLRVVRMVGSGVHLELGHEPAPEAVLRQHALDGETDHARGMLGQHL